MAQIVVVGSVNMDVVNLVERHPLPGETVHGRGTSYHPGGKGANQAVAAALAGARVTMAGAVGTDGFGGELLSVLQQVGVHTGFMLRKEGPSGLAFITVNAEGENNIILSAGANGALSEKDLDGKPGLWKGATALLVQNEVPWASTLHAIKQAKANGLRVYMNPAPAFKLPEEVYPLLDVLVLNETEASVLTGISAGDEKEARQAAAKLLERGVREVVLTLGGKGSVYACPEEAPLHTPAFRVKAVDTTAAGDTFIGAFAASRERGTPAGDALRFASAAAALAVTRQGAQSSIPRREEIVAFLRDNG